MDSTTKGIQKLIEQETKRLEKELKQTGRTIQQHRKRGKQKLRHIVATQGV
jgi:hypothetical protein